MGLGKAKATDERPDPRVVRALDTLLILHADHELNCSTAALRHLTTSGVDVYTAVSGATGALYGPLHGGATEAVLRMLESIGSVSPAIKQQSGGGYGIPRVYLLVGRRVWMWNTGG